MSQATMRPLQWPSRLQHVPLLLLMYSTATMCTNSPPIGVASASGTVFAETMSYYMLTSTTSRRTSSRFMTSVIRGTPSAMPVMPTLPVTSTALWDGREPSVKFTTTYHLTTSSASTTLGFSSSEVLVLQPVPSIVVTESEDLTTSLVSSRVMTPSIRRTPLATPSIPAFRPTLVVASTASHGGHFTVQSSPQVTTTYRFTESQRESLSVLTRSSKESILQPVSSSMVDDLKLSSRVFEASTNLGFETDQFALSTSLFMPRVQSTMIDSILDDQHSSFTVLRATVVSMSTADLRSIITTVVSRRDVSRFASQLEASYVASTVNQFAQDMSTAVVSFSRTMTRPPPPMPPPSPPSLTTIFVPSTSRPSLTTIASSFDIESSVLFDMSEVFPSVSETASRPSSSMPLPCPASLTTVFVTVTATPHPSSTTMAPSMSRIATRPSPPIPPPCPPFPTTVFVTATLRPSPTTVAGPNVMDLSSVSVSFDTYSEDFDVVLSSTDGISLLARSTASTSPRDVIPSLGSVTSVVASVPPTAPLPTMPPLLTDSTSMMPGVTTSMSSSTVMLPSVDVESVMSVVTSVSATGLMHTMPSLSTDSMSSVSGVTTSTSLPTMDAISLVEGITPVVTSVSTTAPMPTFPLSSLLRSTLIVPLDTTSNTLVPFIVSSSVYQSVVEFGSFSLEISEVTTDSLRATSSPRTVILMSSGLSSMVSSLPSFAVTSGLAVSSTSVSSEIAVTSAFTRAVSSSYARMVTLPSPVISSSVFYTDTRYIISSAQFQSSEKSLSIATAVSASTPVVMTTDSGGALSTSLLSFLADTDFPGLSTDLGIQLSTSVSDVLVFPTATTTFTGPSIALSSRSIVSMSFPIRPTLPSTIATAATHSTRIASLSLLSVLIPSSASSIANSTTAASKVISSTVSTHFLPTTVDVVFATESLFVVPTAFPVGSESFTRPYSSELFVFLSTLQAESTRSHTSTLVESSQLSTFSSTILLTVSSSDRLRITSTSLVPHSRTPVLPATSTYALLPSMSSAFKALSTDSTMIQFAETSSTTVMTMSPLPSVIHPSTLLMSFMFTSDLLPSVTPSADFFAILNSSVISLQAPSTSMLSNVSAVVASTTSFSSSTIFSSLLFNATAISATLEPLSSSVELVISSQLLQSSLSVMQPTVKAVTSVNTTTYLATALTSSEVIGVIMSPTSTSSLSDLPVSTSQQSFDLSFSVSFTTDFSSFSSFSIHPIDGQISLSESSTPVPALPTSTSLLHEAPTSLPVVVSSVAATPSRVFGNVTSSVVSSSVLTSQVATVTPLLPVTTTFYSSISSEIRNRSSFVLPTTQTFSVSPVVSKISVVSSTVGPHLSQLEVTTRRTVETMTVGRSSVASVAVSSISLATFLLSPTPTSTFIPASSQVQSTAVTNISATSMATVLSVSHSRSVASLSVFITPTSLEASIQTSSIARVSKSSVMTQSSSVSHNITTMLSSTATATSASTVGISKSSVVMQSLSVGHNVTTMLSSTATVIAASTVGISKSSVVTRSSSVGHNITAMLSSTATLITASTVATSRVSSLVTSALHMNSSTYTIPIPVASITSSFITPSLTATGLTRPSLMQNMSVKIPPSTIGSSATLQVSSLLSTAGVSSKAVFITPPASTVVINATSRLTSVAPTTSRTQTTAAPTEGILNSHLAEIVITITDLIQIVGSDEWQTVVETHLERVYLEARDLQQTGSTAQDEVTISRDKRSSRPSQGVRKKRSLLERIVKSVLRRSKRLSPTVFVSVVNTTVREATAVITFTIVDGDERLNATVICDLFSRLGNARITELLGYQVVVVCRPSGIVGTLAPVIGEGGLDAWVIVVVVLGVILLLFLMCLLYCCWRFHYTSRHRISTFTPTEKRKGRVKDGKAPVQLKEYHRTGQDEFKTSKEFLSTADTPFMSAFERDVETADNYDTVSHEKQVFTSSSEEVSLVNVKTISGIKRDGQELNRMPSAPRESCENVFARSVNPESPPPGEYSDIREPRPASVVETAAHMSAARPQPTEYQKRYSVVRRPAMIPPTAAAWSEAERLHEDNKLTDDRVEAQDETDVSTVQVKPAADEAKRDEVHEQIALDEFQRQQQVEEERQIEQETQLAYKEERQLQEAMKQKMELERWRNKQRQRERERTLKRDKHRRELQAQRKERTQELQAKKHQQQKQWIKAQNELAGVLDPEAARLDLTAPLFSKPRRKHSKQRHWRRSSKTSPHPLPDAVHQPRILPKSPPEILRQREQSSHSSTIPHASEAWSPPQPEVAQVPPVRVLQVQPQDPYKPATPNQVVPNAHELAQLLVQAFPALNQPQMATQTVHPASQAASHPPEATSPAFRQRPSRSVPAQMTPQGDIQPPARATMTRPRAVSVSPYNPPTMVQPQQVRQRVRAWETPPPQGTGSQPITSHRENAPQPYFPPPILQPQHIDPVHVTPVTRHVDANGQTRWTPNAHNANVFHPYDPYKRDFHTLFSTPEPPTAASHPQGMGMSQLPQPSQQLPIYVGTGRGQYPSRSIADNTKPLVDAIKSELLRLQSNT